MGVAAGAGAILPGQLTLRDLWAQHNEHRLFLPRLIMLALARLSGWNTHVEMLANIGLALGIFGVLAYPGVVRDGAEVLKEYHLSVFRKMK